MAEQAARVEISRSRGGATLHESVCIRLDVDPDTDLVTWDSYRNPEGRWVVTAFHDGGSIGTWVFDEVGHTVHPQDESARALMGGGPSIVTTASAPSDAPDVVDHAGHLEATPQEAPVAESPADDALTDPGAAAADDEPEPTRPRLVSVTSDPTATTTRETQTDQQELLTKEDVPEVAANPRREKRSKSKRGRASVPSWDEILFGAAKKND